MSCNSKNFSKPRNFLLLEKYFGRFYNFVSGSGMTPAILGNDIIHIPGIFRIWSFGVFEFSKKIFVKILILYQENIILQKVALFQKWLLILFIQLQLSTIQKCCFLLSFMESPANGTTMSKTGYPLMVCN